MSEFYDAEPNFAMVSMCRHKLLHLPAFGAASWKKFDYSSGSHRIDSGDVKDSQLVAATASDLSRRAGSLDLQNARTATVGISSPKHTRCVPPGMTCLKSPHYSPGFQSVVHTFMDDISIIPRNTEICDANRDVANITIKRKKCHEARKQLPGGLRQETVFDATSNKRRRVLCRASGFKSPGYDRIRREQRCTSSQNFSPALLAWSLKVQSGNSVIDRS